MIKNIPFFIDLEQFHVIVIHYTLTLFLTHYLSPKARKKLRAFKGLKACFIQDEYRFVNKTIEALEDLGIDIIFTCVPESEFEKVYTARLKKVTCVNVLTGYVPKALKGLHVPTYTDRPIDVSYRARKLPYYLGELAQEKFHIAQKFAEDGKKYDLVTDMNCAENQRLYGQKWIDFMCQSKACLGVESGASVFDFTGEIQQNVENYLEKKPDASFEEVQALFFAEAEGKIKLNQISPRCFEAAALRTLMILYEGEYSGILHPWKHYVPLRKDHSNMEEVVDVIKNPKKAKKIIDCAYAEIALNAAYSYQKLTNIFDDTLGKRSAEKNYDSAKKIRPAQHLALYKKYHLLNTPFVMKKKFFRYLIHSNWAIVKYLLKIYRKIRINYTYKQL